MFRFGPLVWRSSKERKKGNKAARNAKCNSGDSGIQIEVRKREIEKERSLSVPSRDKFRWKFKRRLRAFERLEWLLDEIGESYVVERRLNLSNISRTSLG